MSRKIIVAPLSWGLGHASRCVPIIRKLLQEDFTPVIASDGFALSFLQKEFLELEVLELPSYNIRYGKNLQWKLLFQLPRILRTIQQEKKTIKKYIAHNESVCGIISDNRFGVYSKNVPSVYITHQINVLSGILTPLTTLIHQRIIRKYKECWIPDDEKIRLSGRLSSTRKNVGQKYIGILSRFQKKESENEIDILIVLSGPEPNRSLLEEKLKEQFKDISDKVCLIRGVVENDQKTEMYGNLKVVNFMLSEELEQAFNAAKVIICRSGYSSVMDLISLQKNALLIPTKEQKEQEYLAKHLKQRGLFDFVEEDSFTKNSLKNRMNKDVLNYKTENLSADLFRLFNRE